MCSSDLPVLHVGAYDHVVLGDQPNHWVLNVHVVRVRDFAGVVNREPEKHDRFELIHYTELLRPRFYNDFTPLAGGLRQFLTANKQRIAQACIDIAL